MIHGRCKTSPQELIDKAKTSIGTDSEHLSFLLIQGIKKLKSIPRIIYVIKSQFDSS